MKILKINGYRFNELTEKAQEQVIYNFYEMPFDSEDDNGNIIYDYFADWQKNEQIDFCLMNNYYFTKYGSIIGGIL